MCLELDLLIGNERVRRRGDGRGARGTDRSFTLRHRHDFAENVRFGFGAGLDTPRVSDHLTGLTVDLRYGRGFSVLRVQQCNGTRESEYHSCERPLHAFLLFNLSTLSMHVAG